MEILSFVQNIWPCIQQTYPDLVKGIAEIVGGFTLLYRTFSSSFAGKLGIKLDENNPIFGRILKVFEALALNKR